MGDGRSGCVWVLHRDYINFTHTWAHECQMLSDCSHTIVIVEDTVWNKIPEQFDWCFFDSQSCKAMQGRTRVAQKKRQWVSVVLFLLPNQCCREEHCLNSHYCTTKTTLFFPNYQLLELKQSCLHTKWDSFFYIITAAFVPTVCRGGRTNHFYCGPLSVCPEEGLPQRDLHSSDVLYKLYPGTRHGDKSKLINCLFFYLWCSENQCFLCITLLEVNFKVLEIVHMSFGCCIVTTKYGLLPLSPVRSSMCDWNGMECHFPYSSHLCINDISAPVELYLCWLRANTLLPPL